MSGGGAVWWRIAWRNLWRNRRRTVITAAALAFGFFAAVLMVGLSDGIVAEMIDNGTGLVSGQVQAHARGYLPKRDLYSTLGGDEGVDVARVLDIVARTPGVTAATPRVYGGGLLSAGKETSAGVLVGVEVSREAGVSRLLGSIRRGRAPAEGARELAIGTELARKLGVAPGDEIVVVAPAADGSLGNDLFRISGVFHTGMAGLDDGYAVLPIRTLQNLLALSPGRIHEVAASIADPWAADSVAAAAEAALGGAGIDVNVEGWPTYRPELREYASLALSMNWVIVAIVFIMAIFGVANTMLMGTFERRREFAVVRALGTAPGGIGRTVVYEGLILGAMALLGGVLLTVPIVIWFHRAPPSVGFLFGDFTMGGALLRPVLRVEPSVHAPVLSAIALLATAVLAALYPAWRATRVPPADALAGR